MVAHGRETLMCFSNILSLFICLSFYFVLYTINCFSFIFPNIIISIVSQEIFNGKETFFVKKKRHGPEVSFLKATRKLGIKPPNLPQPFQQLGR